MYSLEEMSDRLEILEIIAQYGQLMDERNVDGLMDLFTEDLEFSYQGGLKTIKGRDRVREFVQQALDWATGGPTAHVMCNTTIEVNGDAAKSTTTAVAYHSDDVRVATRGLRYQDSYRRVEGRLKISSHEHFVDWQFDAPTVTPGVVSEVSS